MVGSCAGELGRRYAMDDLVLVASPCSLWDVETDGRRRRSSDDAFVCFGLQDLQGYHGGSERAEKIYILGN